MEVQKMYERYESTKMMRIKMFSALYRKSWLEMMDVEIVTQESFNEISNFNSVTVENGE